jgi:hypothetical protein
VWLENKIANTEYVKQDVVFSESRRLTYAQSISRNQQWFNGLRGWRCAYVECFDIITGYVASGWLIKKR